MTKTRKNIKKSNIKNNKNKKRYLQRHTNKIYKGGAVYNTCTEDDIQDFIRLRSNGDWKGIGEIHKKCCPSVNLGKMGVFKNNKGMVNQTKRCKQMIETANKLYQEENNENDTSNENDMIITKPVGQYGQPLNKPSSSSMCNIL